MKIHYKKRTGRCSMDTAQIQRKRDREKRTVRQMIRIYCKKKHHPDGLLCPECSRLADYADARTDKCPFMETKTSCKNCRVHCYSPEMRDQIRKVMRFSGPRMIWHMPGEALRHILGDL